MPLDIGLGLIAGALFHRLTGLPLPTSVVLAVGFVLLPDLDALVQIFRRRSVTAMDMAHRNLLHVPLLYVPIGTALAYALLGPSVAALFCVMSLLHFVHDSIGTGWGIAWLRPFGQNFYKLFSRQDEDASVTLSHIIATWTPEEQRIVAERYGNPQWLRDMYVRWEPRYRGLLFWEIVFLIGGLIAIAVSR